MTSGLWQPESAREDPVRSSDFELSRPASRIAECYNAPSNLMLSTMAYSGKLSALAMTNSNYLDVRKYLNVSVMRLRGV